jgi:hypothetical protein
MTLWVRAFGAYRAEIASGWRSQDYLVRNLVKSLKGEPFNGYSDFKLGGRAHQINAQDDKPAYALWANWAGVRIRDDLNLGQVTLVPVPSSSQTRFGQDTCPVRMANSVAALIPKAAVVGNFLRHKAAQPKAHSEGGTRDADQIEPTLACRVTDTSLPVVLIDDVMTTGGHLKACARVLREHGLTVEHVLLAGRTVWEIVPNPISVQPEDIENIFDVDAWLRE